MDMKIDTQRIKAERAKRAWSQEHLAEAAGLGLRTIHRIEKSGSASLESVKALASVFELDIENLCLSPDNPGAADVEHSTVAALWSGGFYVLMSAIHFGAMGLDILYARLLSYSPPAAGTSEIFERVADSLLSLWVWGLLTGVAAIICGWQSRASRNLFLASVGITLVVPLLLVPFVDVTQDTSVAGAMFRVLVGAVTTGLAIVGQLKLLRGRQGAALLH